LTTVQAAIARAVDAGYKEIAITGVHLGSYGRDLGDGSTLVTLVRLLAEWPQDVLFRISSLEPMDCGPEIIEAVAASPRLAPHFHLPLQHASDEMLRAMRRPYTSASFQALVGSIRALMPHASIGSDLIVGFPGETDRHARELEAFVGASPLTHLHVFPYSHRPGTSASHFADLPDGAVVRERGRAVRAIGERLAREFRASQLGTIRRALVVDDGTAGVTDNYLRVRLDRRSERNTWVDVEVTAPDHARVL
jgi:threonylcarbamoyladenosine tRNA methylthiotransferase MtaB